MIGTKAVVARTTELEAVDQFLASAREGPGVLLIEGEAGIGKTTVWLAAVDRAERRGFRVLQARPAETEAKLAYTALADLVGSAFDQTRPVLPQPQEHALAAALLRVEASKPVDPRTTATAFVTVLKTLAAEEPVLVAVDDVQWLDRPSRRALQFALRRLRTLPVGFVFSQRDGTGPAVPLGLEETGLERVRLGRLSLGALHHVIAARLDVALPRPTLARIERVTGGNPFYALELARALAEANARLAPSEPLPVPESLSALVTHGVERLPGPTREALLAAASLSSPTIELVATVLSDGAAALRVAEAAGVLEVRDGHVRFTHPLFASAVYAAAAPSERRSMHDRLARVVPDPEEGARHLALATEHPDEEVARALDAGASRAQARGAPDAAAELHERAARLTPEAHFASIHRRLIWAAESSFQCGEPQHAQALLDEVLSSVADGFDRGAALRLLAQIRYSEDSFPEALRLLEEALLHLDAPEVAVPLMLDLSFAHTEVADFAGAQSYATRALELAKRVDTGPLLGEALAVDAIVRYMAGGRINWEKVERALALEDRTRPMRLMMRPSMIAASLDLVEGRLAEARAGFQELREWALARGEEGELPFLLAHLAWIGWWSGNYAAAAEAATEGLLIAAQADSRTMRSLALLHRGAARSYRGEVAAARTDLEESRALMEETGWMFAMLWVLTQLGLLELSVGDVAAAEAALAPAVTHAESAGVGPLALNLFLVDAIEVFVLAGASDRAEKLLASFEAKAREVEATWALAEAARCRSLLLAAAGDDDGALAAAEEAVARNKDVEMPFQVARSFLALGQIRRRRGERSAAREALERARSLFEELGTPLWSERAGAELRRVPIRRGATDELTESEERVAQLAAAGKTNREVAQELFVSPRTVEANLSRVYRKLGISSRAELGAWMAQQIDPDATAKT